VRTGHVPVILKVYTEIKAGFSGGTKRTKTFSRIARGEAKVRACRVSKLETGGIEDLMP